MMQLLSRLRNADFEFLFHYGDIYPEIRKVQLNWITLVLFIVAHNVVVHFTFSRQFWLWH